MPSNSAKLAVAHMALVFSVSAPSTAFTEPFATQVADTLRAQFGDEIDFDNEAERHSDELGWSGWAKLQERGAEACGADNLPHFLSMEAWSGCYLPVATCIGTFKFPGDEPHLDVGALDNLIAELELIGTALGLPLGDLELNEVYRKYIDDDDLVDEDMDIQTFTQLLPLARFAREQRLPLWVIK